MNASKHVFGFYDYIVFAAVLLVSSGIGIFYRFTGGKQKTFKEYMLADQKMSAIPVAFSLMASFMSAITILGVSKENYIFGTQFIAINLSYIIATPIVCYLYLPVFYNLQKISVYEYLEMRFGKLTRLFASLAFSLQMILYMGIVLFAPALALSAVTGISQIWSIISVGIVCTFYSAIGGMKAVLITDVFQSLLMFAAVFAVIFKGVYDFGFKNIFQYALEGERLEFFNYSFDPRVRHTVWSLGIGGIFTYCSLYGVNQTQVQRLLTVRSLKKSRQSLWLQWVILTLLSLSCSFTGLVLYAQYRKCDPQLSGAIDNTDQMLPQYVVQRLGNIPGVSGLFVSGIFSGSLSTVSSAVNSLSAVTLHDYIIPLSPSIMKHGDAKAATVSKILVILYGVLCIGVAFLANFFGTGVLQAALTIFGAVGGPLLSVFTLGMLCRHVGQKGALCGLITGLIMTMFIGFGQPKPPPPFKPRSIEDCPINSTTSNTSAVSLELNDQTESEDLTTERYLQTFFSNTVRTKKIEAQTEQEIEYLIPQTYFEEGVKHTISKTYLGDGVKRAKPQTNFEVEKNDSYPNKNQTSNEYNLVHELYAISYMWVATLGFIVTFIVSNIVSVITCEKKNIDRKLLSKYVWNSKDKQTSLGLSDDIREHSVTTKEINSHELSTRL